MWKSIYKKALIKDKKKVDKNLNNSFAYNYSSNIAIELMKRLKSTLIVRLIFSFIIFYLLNILLFNSDFKVICEYIYLLLPLNQLQCLIIKKILDHTMKKKTKIYLESNQ